VAYTYDGQATAALGVAYRPDGQGGFDHAGVISLLNSKGEIAFQQRGTQAASEELLDRLRALLSAGNRDAQGVCYSGSVLLGIAPENPRTAY
jgi:hypothetical protein